EIVEVAVGVAHGEVAFVHLPAESLVEEAADVLEAAAEGIGARPLLSLLRRIGEEDRAGHLPVGTVGPAAGLEGGLLVGVPGVGQDIAGHEAMAERLE